MDKIAEIARRLWHLLNRRRFEAELRQELDEHRARLDDPRRLGNALRLREEARDVWGWSWLDDLSRDLRFGVRGLRRSPVFTLTSVLVLSLGIGVNLAFFQVVDEALIQPPHVEDPATLVRFYRRGPHFTSTAVAYPIANYIERRTTVLSAVLTRYQTTVAWTDRGEKRLPVAFVSPNWFGELGASAARGRLIGAADARPAGTPAVVVSHQFWQQQLGGRGDVVGSVVRLNDHPAVIVGVAAPTFSDVQLDNTTMWMSIVQIGALVPGSRVGVDWSAESDMYARLSPGISRDAAKASLRTTMAELARVEPQHVAADEWLEPYLGTEQFKSPQHAQEVRNVVFVLSLLAALVLLIACFNLGHLTLARALARAREIGIRAGLGASRWRIVRHLLAECGLLAALGGVGGLAMGQAAIRVLTRVMTPLSRLDLTPDWRVGLAMFACAMAALLVVGLLPAWKVARSDLALAARDGGERLSQGLQSVRLKRLLIGGQIAGCCLLLVFTAQLTRTVRRALSPDLGFEYANVAVLDPSLGAYGLNSAAAQRYWLEVRRVIEAQPQTAATALAAYAPLSGQSNTSRYSSLPQLRITVMTVEPSFFGVMRIPILAGRTFEPHETRQTSVIVSRRVVLEMYGTMDVVGRRYPKVEPHWTIVGVAGDAHLIDPHATNVGEHYFPIADDVVSASLLVRADRDPEQLLGPIRRAARAADAQIVPETRLMRDDFERTLQGPTLARSIAGAVSTLALVLACVGLFGVISQSARLRTKEIGVRLALGAQDGAIVHLLLRQTIWPAALGVALGVGGGALLTRGLAGAPFYLDWRDPAAYGAAVVVLAMTGAAAAVLPALRTLRSNPLQTLRQD